MKKPLVSVVMSTYNDEDYIEQAVNSILCQTFEHFEFIIIDDGSNDNTHSILSKYKDSRIKLITQPNKGLVDSLNRGVEIAKGYYIARHDSDDLSDPTRLEKQVNYFQKNSSLVLVGSSMKVMNNQGKILHTHHVLLNDPELRQELMIRSPFAHGSVMFKRDETIRAGLYNNSFWPAEDYEFWLRLSKFGSLANIDEPLYIYREHSGGISSKNKVGQQKKVADIQDKAWQQRKRLISKKNIDLSIYNDLVDGQQRINRILDNIRVVSKKAYLSKQYAFGLRNTLLISTNLAVYRRIAGHIKRRVRK